MEQVFKEFTKKPDFKKELLEPPPKKKRTSEDFVSFCEFILEYENYDAIKQEELRQKNSSPGSTDSNDDSHHSKNTDNESDDGVTGGDDSWDLITCYCMKPFAGRPMIECSECQTWVHLSCAKIRRNNIPENFVCQTCKDAKLTTRRSQRVRSESRRIFL